MLATPRIRSALASGPAVSMVRATFGRSSSALTFGAVGAVQMTISSLSKEPYRDDARVPIAAVVRQPRRLGRQEELFGVGMSEIPSSSAVRHTVLPIDPFGL